VRTAFLALAALACPVLAYNLYWANLHSHTGYSDGVGTPRHAFAYARDTAHIQVLAVTDHSRGLLADTLFWPDVKAQADSATIPGSFVGIAGFEWTHATLGHANVLFTDSLSGEFWLPSMAQLYGWMYFQPTVVGQYNHPGSAGFDAYAYSDTGDASMALFEMQDSVHADRYRIPLDSGWHIGFACNQDNHGANWGAGPRLTGIWADSLTRTSIYSAIRDMRAFGTQDRNLTLRLFANDSWMGSTIANGPIRLRVEAADLDSLDYFARLDIITNGGVILDSLVLGNSSHVAWECSTATNPGERRYFYCRIIQNDRDRAASSAVWTEDPTGLESDARAGSRLRVAPNPFISIATAPGRETEPFVLYDIAGKAVSTCTGDRVGTGLSAGVYCIRAGDGTMLRVVKLR
jgi:hypothetical protein